MTHGGDRYSACQGTASAMNQLVDFSANIMPFGLGDTVRQAIINGLDECCHYPDPCQRELRRQLADWHQLDPGQIVCGNGAADVLYRTIQVLKPRRVFLPVPTFLEYEKACREQEAQIVHFPLRADDGFAVTDRLVAWLETQTGGRNGVSDSESAGTDAGNSASTRTSASNSAGAGIIPKGADLLILCNPNNPTGLLIAPALLQRIVACCRRLRISLLLDECFLDFVDEADSLSLLPLLNEPPADLTLLILRSMTKFYAMPGLRLGYLCTGPDLARAIQGVGQPWPIGTLAEIAGLAAIRQRRQEGAGETEARQQWLQTERARLGTALAARHWQVWPGQANYIFFRAPGCPGLVERLLRDRLLIRSCANYPGLGPDYYRIAIRTPAEDQLLIDALQAINLTPE
jgi:threonine-phosphate decarboxylase